MAFSAWTLSSLTLIGGNYEMAVGAYNGSIFLLGGYPNVYPERVTRYDVNTNTFINTITSTSSNLYGSGQYWTQIDHIIYMITGSYSWPLNTYNIITNEYKTELIAFNKAVARGCLASSSEYLFVTGGEAGGSAHNELQILHLITHQWVNNTPSMNVQKRMSHACVVHNDYLWVFGGNDEVNGLQSNELISIIDIAHNIWSYVDELSVPLTGLRAVSLFNTIYLIGGYNHINDLYSDIVHLVDADTGTVVVSVDKLPNGNGYGSPIIVDSTLYVFGGFADEFNVRTDDWTYYPLTTPDSSEPSSTPSSHPSLIPSSHPSSSVSTKPSPSPTFNVTTTAISSSIEHQSVMMTETKDTISISTDTKEFNDTPYTTTDAILSSYRYKTSIQTSIYTTNAENTNASSFLTQYPLKTVSTKEQTNAIIATTTVGRYSQDERDQSSLSLSTTIINIIIAVSSVCVMLFVCVFGRMYYHQMSEKRVKQLMDDIVVIVPGNDVKGNGNKHDHPGYNDNDNQGEANVVQHMGIDKVETTGAEHSGYINNDGEDDVIVTKGEHNVVVLDKYTVEGDDVDKRTQDKAGEILQTSYMHDV